MRIERYERPDNLAKAAHLVLDEGGYPLAGAVWSGIGARRIPLAVDLSRLDLDYIADRGDCIEIGAMTTARQLETSALLEAVYDGLFRSATGHIAGVQLRNIVTVGGSVAGKYGFSDLDTLLLALGAQLLFYGGGVMSMEGFLAAPRTEAFLLLALRLPKGVKASYQSLRISANDFPALNACAAREEGG
ncbi:MAG TPA: FAD binding domain-containing protein, partial [Rectinemataceae bacterium]